MFCISHCSFPFAFESRHVRKKPKDLKDTCFQHRCDGRRKGGASGL